MINYSITLIITLKERAIRSPHPTLYSYNISAFSLQLFLYQRSEHNALSRIFFKLFISNSHGCATV